MNWTEDGSVIESTKQIMTEQKYTFQRKNVQQYEFRKERKKRCEKLLVCNGLVRIHQWNEEKVENSIFNAISYRLLIQCRNFLICLRCLRFWSCFEFSFGISTIASRLGLGIERNLSFSNRIDSVVKQYIYFCVKLFCKWRVHRFLFEKGAQIPMRFFFFVLPTENFNQNHLHHQQQQNYAHTF